MKNRQISKLISRKNFFTKQKTIIAISVTVVAVAAIVAAIYLVPNVVTRVSAIAAPTYPAKTSYMNSFSNDKISPSGNFISSLKTFSSNSASVVLSGGQSGKNSLYSPLSLYFALALASAGAKGQTQSEIQNALSMGNLSADDISTQSGILFRSVYLDNEIGRLKLANSLWLGKNVNFNKSYLDDAAKNYYASSFDVDFGSPSTAKKIGKWVSDNTGGKLGSDVTTDPKEVMSLINTVYFYDQWVNEFDANKTASGVFHAQNGDVQCNFMNAQTEGSFVTGDGFTAAELPFKNNEAMLFILPNKGVLVNDIIENPQKLSNALDFTDALKNAKNCSITYKIPKFSFGASLDLKETLEKLGVKTAFSKNADFSNISETTPLSISDIDQSTHISIDEKGCEAAAYTQIDFVGAARIEGNAEMILDRPFIFAIIHNDGLPVFIGTVNDPSQN
jgi:serpin B